MVKNSKVTPEESLLFRESVGTVRPIKHDKVDITPRLLPSTTLRKARYEAQHAVEDTISDGYMPADNTEIECSAGFVRNGIQQGVLRKLKRGQFAPEAELDLHGLTVNEARSTLLQFLQHCRDNDIRHARIIHGQGNSSHMGRPVLKVKVYLWLQQLGDVLAFCPARPEHGGNGALYLLLRRHQK